MQLDKNSEKRKLTSRVLGSCEVRKAIIRLSDSQCKITIETESLVPSDYIYNNYQKRVHPSATPHKPMSLLLCSPWNYFLLSILSARQRAQTNPAASTQPPSSHLLFVFFFVLVSSFLVSTFRARIHQRPELSS